MLPQRLVAAILCTLLYSAELGNKHLNCRQHHMHRLVLKVLGMYILGYGCLFGVYPSLLSVYSW